MIEARTPDDGEVNQCAGCGGQKQSPLAGLVTIGDLWFAICQECGRDLANAVGFLCIREGGHSKLVPRKRRAKLVAT